MWEIFPRQVFCVKKSHEMVKIRNQKMSNPANPPLPDSPPVTDSVGAVVGPSPAVVKALQMVLRPLVRLMLAQGVTYPYLAEMLKGLFVQVARDEFGLKGQKPTDSRISLLSGVHRKDVSRLRDVPAQSSAPAVVPLGAQVVARWTSDPRYLDALGRPLPLARLISESAEQSFEALVSGVSSDIRSRVLLDEWLQQGVVHLDSEGRVGLNMATFVPSQGSSDKAYYLGHNLGDHAAAAVHNLLGRQPPFMERSVHYGELPPAAVADLAALAQDQGMAALLTLNRAAKAVNAPASSQGPGHRFTFGVYFYSAPDAVDQDPVERSS